MCSRSCCKTCCRPHLLRCWQLVVLHQQIHDLKSFLSSDVSFLFSGCPVQLHACPRIFQAQDAIIPGWKRQSLLHQIWFWRVFHPSNFYLSGFDPFLLLIILLVECFYLFSMCYKITSIIIWLSKEFNYNTYKFTLYGSF